uniref:VWFA domain-containing protein n=1 Tax=Magallana gigas TaxID=29159 RepID=A0A8W8IFL5_MAGGI
MDNKQRTSTINVKAEGGSLAAGKHTVTIDQPQEMQLPEVTMSGDYSEHPSPISVTVESSGANVTVADQTATLINVRSPEEAESSTTDSLLPTDQSSLPPPLSVTGGTSSGDTNLHFFVHEQGKYIQIGQCCVIVEMHVNDQTMEGLKAQGTLEVESQIGASLVTMRWRGNEVDETELRTKIKVQLTSSLTARLPDLERAIPQDMMANQCDKCQQLVTFLLNEFRGYLTDLSLGCIQLTLFFSNREDFQRGRSSEALTKIQKFLDGLLLTDRVNEGFRVTVLEEDDEVGDTMDTTFYSREQEKTTFSENLAEPSNLASGYSGEMLTQDQFTRQISLQVKQSITEELDIFHQAFRQEQGQILRDAIKEVLPDMEQRIIENISTKLETGKETAQPEPDTSSGSGQSSDESKLQVRPRTFVPKSSKFFYEDPNIPDKKQTTGVLPIKPFEGKRRRRKGFNHYLSTASKGSLSESSENLSADEEISDLVSFVQSKVNKPHPEVKVKQRTENRMEKFKVYLEPEITELHEYLKEILGEDSMKVVQQASSMADRVTLPLYGAEISEQFCTVLCVDLSHSMAGQPIKDQATLAAKIIQDCLGHIGLVSIGSETKVEQELTKDRDTALKVIGQLHVEPFHQSSSSPVLQGLFTALKLLQGRVRPTDYGPHHTMYPKVVIISDGLFNDCSPDLEGKQPCQKTDELLKSVLEVMVAMDIKMPIYFVPVGKKQDGTYGWFSKLSIVEDVDFLSDSEVKEMAIERAMQTIMCPSEPETPYKSWQAVKEEITQNHTATMLKQIKWNLAEYFKHPPPIGTRVKMAELKIHQTGTVFCHIQGKGEQTEEVLIVQDNTGGIFTYLWSFDQENIFFYKPSEKLLISEFPEGTLVRKASKTVALKFSHDESKRKELGEKSHSRRRALKSLEQKGTRERKREQQKDDRTGIFF